MIMQYAAKRASRYALDVAQYKSCKVMRRLHKLNVDKKRVREEMSFAGEYNIIINK